MAYRVENDFDFSDNDPPSGPHLCPRRVYKSLKRFGTGRSLSDIKFKYSANTYIRCHPWYIHFPAYCSDRGLLA